jgi:hypothetical protein
VKAKGDAELEIWGAEQKRDLFAEVFGREIAFHESER